MTNDFKRKSPTWIMWDQKAGFYRPAELKSQEHYFGFDLGRLASLGSEEIPRDSISLAASVYLGNRRFECQPQLASGLLPKDYFYLREMVVKSMLQKILADAQKLAALNGVPYFTIDQIVQSGDVVHKVPKSGMFNEEFIPKGTFFEGKYINERCRKKPIGEYISCSKMKHEEPKRFTRDWVFPEKMFYADSKPEVWMLHPTAHLYARKEN